MDRSQFIDLYIIGFYDWFLSLDVLGLLLVASMAHTSCPYVRCRISNGDDPMEELHGISSSIHSFFCIFLSLQSVE
ncbi:unnamed protein product [Peronospora belbahrii]|uniref:Uncharacterized protein n=1 Tax=Peronospora belbahrii TaxID=622444 RepID=A0AAU9LHJ3_9STRA|nr:unnamed protein product [Peronospora belbahrii]CAH0518031.1 unnamed protein product [Peronospora belbahrii]